MQPVITDLAGLFHYIFRLHDETKRGMSAALSSCPKCHFAMLETLSTLIAKHGHLNFLPVNEFLDKRLIAVAERIRHGLLEIFAALRLGNADRRAGSGGLDKDRIGERGLDFIHAGLLLPAPALLRDDPPVSLPDARLPDQ